jgi:hypothetical protein
MKQKSKNAQLRIEMISNLYSSRNIWDDQIKESERDEESIQNLIKKSKRKKPIWRPDRRWEDAIK